ncbi:MAG: fimbrillin family protein [Bacteroidaceae bacterium]|nr:fimbrillin family protein [Bacteroidaceae bacterium]
MKPIRLLLIYLTTLMLVGCDKEEKQDSLFPFESATLPLKWSVLPVESMQGTRSLIENNEGLQDACAATTGEGIGIWGDYEIATNNGIDTIVGFLKGSEGKGVKIIYYGDREDDSPSKWDYENEDEAAYWELGGKYIFRAYYPQTAVKENVVASSNATTFVIDYNTTKLQEDLMVAYQPINTMQWNLSEPVPLKFRHALAGLGFQFQFEEGLYETDYLTSCWLQNTSARDFTSVGMLAYGTEDPNNNYEYNPNWLDWHESYNSPATERMYYWESLRDDTHTDGGIKIQRTSTTNNKATAYTNEEKTTQGYSLLNNNGYVLIIPQPSEGSVQLCFTTYEGGETVYRIPIPIKTGTSTERQRANNSYDENNTLILGDAKDTEPIDEFGYGTDFVAGYLYSYMVTISKTNLGLSLKIAPWNELKSSFDISF